MAVPTSSHSWPRRLHHPLVTVGPPTPCSLRTQTVASTRTDTHVPPCRCGVPCCLPGTRNPVCWWRGAGKRGQPQPTSVGVGVRWVVTHTVRVCVWALTYRSDSHAAHAFPERFQQVLHGLAFETRSRVNHLKQHVRLLVLQLTPSHVCSCAGVGGAAGIRNGRPLQVHPCSCDTRRCATATV